MFTSLGNRYEKEFKLRVDPESPSNYDDIDNDIPAAVSKRAKKTIESSASIKQEILKNNRETAEKIGKMLRRAHGVTDDTTDDDDVFFPSSKTFEKSFINKSAIENALERPRLLQKSFPRKLTKRKRSDDFDETDEDEKEPPRKIADSSDADLGLGECKLVGIEKNHAAHLQVHFKRCFNLRHETFLAQP